MEKFDSIDIDSFKLKCSTRLSDIFFHLFPSGRIRGKEFIIGDLNGKPGDSVSFSLDSSKLGVGGEFNGMGGHKMFSDFIDVWKHKKNVDFITAVEDISNFIGSPIERRPVVAAPEPIRNVDQDKGKVVAEHTYTDPNGNLICTIVRKQFNDGKKSFLPRLASGDFKMPLVRPLYNLVDVSTSDTVIIVEGEKCADALKTMGYVATSAMGGSGAPLEKTDWSSLQNKEITIWPDNDEPGFHYAESLASYLIPICKSVRVLQPSKGKPKGWDVADAVAENFNINKFLSIEDSNRKIINLIDSSLSASRYAQGKSPPYQYLVEETLPKGVAGVLAATGDTGKGLITLDMGLKLAYGTVGKDKVFDSHITENGSVVILTAEDEADEIHRRVESLDRDGYRFRETGHDLKIIPFPNYGGTVPIVTVEKGRPTITPEWQNICDQIKKIDDLLLVVVDPLSSFIYADVNADPAMGSFVTGYFASLATETNATWLLIHHMAKVDIKNPVTTPEHARNLIRGTSAIVDGLRFAMALWTPPEGEIRYICKSLNIEFKRNKVAHGAVVKSNGPANREIRTFLRNPNNGLLEGCTSELGLVRHGTELDLEELVSCIKHAARDGKPFTQTGRANGIAYHKERLTDRFHDRGINNLQDMVQTLIDQARIVKATAGGSKSKKWLDVPGGPFAEGDGEFTTGS